MTHRMDEMQMSINLKAIRTSWVVTLLCLLGWAIYDWIAMSTFNSFAVIILSLQLILYWGVQLILHQKIENDEE